MNNSLELSFVFYYLFVVLAICLNFLVLGIIAYKTRLAGISTPFIQLVTALHISNILEEFALIPFLFKGNTNFCLFMESFKFYSGLMNIFTVFFIVQSFRLALFQNVKGFSLTLRYIAFFLIFLFPLICFLPFSTNSYSYPSDPWCTLSSSTSSASTAWSFLVQFFWVYVIIVLCVMTNLLSLYQLLIKDWNPMLFLRYGKNSGTYSTIMCLSWIPRSILFFTTSSSENIAERFIAYFPVYIAGILNVILFFMNQKELVNFEDAHSSTVGDSIVFDTGDLLNILDQFGTTADASFSVSKKTGGGGSSPDSKVTPRKRLESWQNAKEKQVEYLKETPETVIQGGGEIINNRSLTYSADNPMIQRIELLDIQSSGRHPEKKISENDNGEQV
jgi:hypothetical protein